MEVPECTKILLSRIQMLEPENVNRIIGYLLLKHNQQEIIEYAYGTDELLYSLISEAKAFPPFSPKNNISAPLHPLLHPLCNEQLPYRSFSPAISRRPSSFPSFRVPEPNSDIPHFATEQQLGIRHFDPPSGNELFRDPNYQDDVSNLEEQLKSLNPFGSDNSSNYYPNFELGRRSVSGTGIRSPIGVPNFPSRACYGPIPDNISQMYSPNMYKQVSEPHDHAFSPRPLERLEMEITKLPHDHAFSPRPLERLEMEITKLLRIRRGMPVPIAALPMLYYEMYGRRLHAERYLTESQWHSGISLVQLLAGLKSIRFIDRPHGQLSVVLAEETPKHMEYWNEMGYSGVLGKSDQIYLTFPAESSFTDEDVFNYFQQYGPVRDVRIPHQEKRMFGFVSFLYPESVKLILAKNMPHYICGARVLVKPYKEKIRPNDKKYSEKIELPRHNFFEMDPDFSSSPRACEDPRLLQKLISDSHHFHLAPRACEDPRLLQKQLVRNHELALELERMHFLGLHGAPKPVGYCGNRGTESNHPDDEASVLLNLKNPLLTDEETKHTSNSNLLTDEIAKHTSNTSEQDRHIELPKSPLASP